jgi:hypothetical protein
MFDLGLSSLSVRSWTRSLDAACNAPPDNSRLRRPVFVTVKLAASADTATPSRKEFSPASVGRGRLVDRTDKFDGSAERRPAKRENGGLEAAAPWLLIECIDFHQRDSGRLVHASHDRGVVAGNERCDNG